MKSLRTGGGRQQTNEVAPRFTFPSIYLCLRLSRSSSFRRGVARAFEECDAHREPQPISIFEETRVTGVPQNLQVKGENVRGDLTSPLRHSQKGLC